MKTLNVSRPTFSPVQSEPESYSSRTLDTNLKAKNVPEKHIYIAYGEIPASEINFMRSSSPHVIEPLIGERTWNSNSLRIIKRPLPPSKIASRRKAYVGYSNGSELYCTDVSVFM